MMNLSPGWLFSATPVAAEEPARETDDKPAGGSRNRSDPPNLNNFADQMG
jgi:hypothetical protein